MIRGTITAEREAVLRLTVRGPSNQEEEVEAVLDTGFNDYLTLPPSLVTRLGLAFAAPTQATLANARNYSQCDSLLLGDRCAAPHPRSCV